MNPENQRAHVLALIFSVPAAFVFLSMASVSESMNNAFLGLAAIVFIVSLPWSLIALVIFLFAVPMNSGLRPDISGYYWRAILAYSAPVITVLGAHLNGFYLFRQKSSSSKFEINDSRSRPKDDESV